MKHSKASYLEIYVTDNGIGFNQEELDSSGIGLSNISKRADLVNAELLLKSEPNKGTTLSIKYKY